MLSRVLRPASDFHRPRHQRQGLLNHVRLLALDRPVPCSFRSSRRLSMISADHKVFGKIRIPKDIENDCWIYEGPVDRQGYGKVSSKEDERYVTLLAHRVSFRSHVGPLDAEKVVMHSCDTPGCVNWKHLSQ